MTALPLKYDAACRALAEARSFDEVREWEDKAAAVKEYTRRIGNRSLEMDALEIRERARRRRGELLLELKENGQLTRGKDQVREPGLERVNLDDLNISKNESSRDQKIAAIDGNSFERLIARCRAHLEQESDKHSMDVLREQDGPINGARSIMGSRQEPDDSLDYSPTPPWGTRALIERVFPTLGIATPITTIWEPACGEGHMAEVLAEYSDNIIATDIFDYGYGGGGDFLEDKSGYRPDWIITNPPFKNAELFALAALERAEVGVAMFVRWQWIETIGRYERLFQPFPPTLVAVFAERIPLHMGRWEPKGATATAYCWVVWFKSSPSWGAGLPTLLHWIPPGCRDSLTRADDNIRFTTHPVTRRIPPHNPNTGEIIEADSIQERPVHLGSMSRSNGGVA